MFFVIVELIKFSTIMLYALLHHFPLTVNVDAEILIKFFKFYCSEFRPEDHFINVSSRAPFLKKEDHARYFN